MTQNVFPDITGRDWFIVGEGLVYAIMMIDSLPVSRQDASARAEMVQIFDNLFPGGDLRQKIIAGVEKRTRRKSALAFANGGKAL